MNIRRSKEKNDILNQERNISFEQAAQAIYDGNILFVWSHPNTEQYPNQSIFVFAYEKYAYVVPFVQTWDEIFLKTIYPSRIRTKRFLS
jgi:hypothetical protein